MSSSRLWPKLLWSPPPTSHNRWIPFLFPTELKRSIPCPSSFCRGAGVQSIVHFHQPALTSQSTARPPHQAVPAENSLQIRALDASVGHVGAHCLGCGAVPPSGVLLHPPPRATPCGSPSIPAFGNTRDCLHHLLLKLCRLNLFWPQLRWLQPFGLEPLLAQTVVVPLLPRAHN